MCWPAWARIQERRRHRDRRQRPGINDGASAVVLVAGDRLQALGVKPLARLVGYAHAGAGPAYMNRPRAGHAASWRTGLSARHGRDRGQRGLAAQACAGQELAGPGQVNPNGSGISLGHSVRATGAIITKAIAELHRTGGHALVTMCIGGGQGIAAIYERV